MKKIIKKGIENLPLVYQLADVIETKQKDDSIVTKEVRPNRFVKLEKYNADKTHAYGAPKPISKIV